MEIEMGIPLSGAEYSMIQKDTAVFENRSCSTREIEFESLSHIIFIHIYAARLYCTFYYRTELNLIVGKIDVL